MFAVRASSRKLAAIAIAVVAATTLQPVAPAQAAADVTFVIAVQGSSGIEYRNFTGGTLASGDAISGQLLSRSEDLLSSVWRVPVSRTVSVPVLKTSEMAQVLPNAKALGLEGKTLIGSTAASFVGLTYTFQMVTVANDDANLVTQAVPKAPLGFDRKIESSAASGDLLLLSSSDRGIGTTEPVLGNGVLWFTTGTATAPRQVAETPSGYVSQLSFRPGIGKHVAALEVDLSGTPRVRVIEFDITDGGVVSGRTSGSYIEFGNSASAFELYWGRQGDAYAPVVALTRGAQVDLYSSSGSQLVSVSAGTFVGIAPDGGSIDPSQGVGEKASTRIFVSGVPSKAIFSYGAQPKLTTGAEASVQGWAWPVLVTASIPKTLTKNTCVSIVATSTVWTQSATNKTCLFVRHKLNVTAKKRVLTVDTTALDVNVTQIIGKKAKLLAKRLHPKKGRLTYKLAKGGQFEVTALASKSNVATSSKIRVK